MIAFIRGTLLSRGKDACVVETDGVGYEVHLPQPALLALPALGEPVEFFTHFHVREDAQQLFGFASIQEKELFLLLLTVKGVGPKVALALLSQMGVAGLAEALRRRNLAKLGSAAGVGRKLAERLAVELSDRVAKTADFGAATGLAQPGPWDDSQSKALQALLALGYSSQQAKQAVARVYQDLGADSTRVEDIVRKALKFF